MVLPTNVFFEINFNNFFLFLLTKGEGHAAGGAVGLGTELQDGKSWVRFPMV
jgi:hypothetical protein